MCLWWVRSRATTRSPYSPLQIKRNLSLQAWTNYLASVDRLVVSFVETSLCKHSDCCCDGPMSIVRCISFPQRVKCFVLCIALSAKLCARHHKHPCKYTKYGKREHAANLAGFVQGSHPHRRRRILFWGVMYCSLCASHFDVLAAGPCQWRCK